LRRRNGSKRET